MTSRGSQRSQVASLYLTVGEIDAREKVDMPRWLEIGRRPTRIGSGFLERQYQEIKDEVRAAINEVLPAGEYTLGPNVQAFEEEFAAYCGTKYCVGMSSGTEALHLAVAACGVGPGDEVITTCSTYVSTAFAASYVGATPVFVDIDPVSYNMDVLKMEEKITEKTKAIIPVHLYGQPVDMDPLNEIAKRHGLWVIEDAAHSPGALYKGRKAGSLGDIGCFSFYPGKNIGAYGDGGAITTDNEELYEKVKILRYIGQKVKFVYEVVGFNERLDELQAAILRVKLRHLDQWNERRRRWARLYDELLEGLPIALPKESDFAKHVYYAYTILCENREDLMEWLADRDIGTYAMYPYLVPLVKAYRYLGYKEEDFPIGDRCARQFLCLPMFPELTEEEVRTVGEAIQEYYTS